MPMSRQTYSHNKKLNSNCKITALKSNLKNTTLDVKTEHSMLTRTDKLQNAHEEIQQTSFYHTHEIPFLRAMTRMKHHHHFSLNLSCLQDHSLSHDTLASFRRKHMTLLRTEHTGPGEKSFHLTNESMQ